jgi:Uma2 family endonuclease
MNGTPPRPDVCFWRKDIADTFEEEQMHFPAPDFVVEVLLKKTAKIDRTVKFVDYEAHGVSEYWMVEPVKKVIAQYVLINGNYHLRFKGATGIIKSEAIVGFEMEVEAIFSNTPVFKLLKHLLK